MHTVAIIPARSDSSRLPRKHLQTVCGRPMLAYLVTRLLAMPEISRVVLATTDRHCDDELAETAEAWGAAIFRGDLNDVLGRVSAAASHFKADWIVKANGDNPLQAPEVIQVGLEQLRKSGVDLVSGKHAYTGLPIGLGAEILTAEALTRLDRNAPAEHRESITGFVFSEEDNWRWKAIECPTHWQYPQGSLTIDTTADFEKLIKVAEGLQFASPKEWRIEMIIEELKKYDRSTS